MVLDGSDERDRLAAIAADSWYALGVNAATIHYSGHVFSRHFRGSRCLELGPAEGLMTDLLIGAFDSLTVVDGSAQFCRDLEKRYPAVEVRNSLFEDYDPVADFDTIVLGHVLEHVDDPVLILALVREWLAPDGVVLAAVPNALSIHRQAAVRMGLLESEYQLNETDHHHGHRRVYDEGLLRTHFESAGLEVMILGGYWLKPLSNRQTEDWFTPEMLQAFMELGEKYPDIAGELYVVAHR